MKSLLILTMPLLIVVTLISSVHFFNHHAEVISFVLYVAFWVSASLWIAALSSKNLKDLSEG